jgi:serine phosphatase RsbU (regulator of sigma subunit)
MTAIRAVIREAAYDGLDPAAVLATANEFICARESELFATAIFGVLDARLGTFTFVSAGHPPPLLAGAGGAKFLASRHPDCPLGLARPFLPRTVITSVPMETLLVLYTDGVTEHERDVLRGEAQLFAAAIEIERDGSLPTATAIAEHMGLEDSNHDDAAILTAWIPYSTSRKRFR